MKKIAILFLMLGLAPVTVAHQLLKSQQMPDGLGCTFEKSVLFTATATGELKVRLTEHKEQFVLEQGGLDASKIIFSGLNTNKPVVRGNLREIGLDVINRERDGEILYLRSTGGGAGEVLYTIYRKNKVVIESRQTDLTPLLPEVVPLGTMAIGKCE